MRWLSWAGLAAVLVLDVWLRCHTIAPTVRDRFGVAPWPVVGSQSEPLDCDEAIYAYIGKRIVAGDVMYRDLTENKPPGGYWLFALAVAIGGPNETAIRLMPVPMVLVTIALVWWIAGRLAGPLAAFVSALIYALMSTDPFLYGNGANMEHAINMFGALSLALMVRSWPREGRSSLVMAGLCVGAASLIKQVAVVPLFVFAIALMVRKARARRERLLDVAALIVGFASAWGMAISVLILQGAGRPAFEDIVRYGGALATDTPHDPKEYPFFVRWIVGNTDPNGRLPWPFGTTLGRAWWAAGSWPLWMVSVPAMAGMGLSRDDARKRLVAGWTVAAWVAVAMPQLFWQHYYLLPLPGVAITVAVSLSDACRRVAWLPVAYAGLLASAIVATAVIQVRDYLLVTPDALTEKDKGGAQWIVLREFGRELGKRTRSWKSPHLFVWGIHSPLYFYSGLDGVTPQLFTDPLMAAFSGSEHPLIRPRIERTLRDLKEKRPELIFVGEKPFPALTEFLRSEYQSSILPGLWVRRDRYREFESFPSTFTLQPPRGPRPRSSDNDPEGRP
jgi:4-amino-4-deoxy-L-arabinose transferase-like glycosyltransferase